MELNDAQKQIWELLKEELGQEPVAGPDHVERMTTWCEKLGAEAGADMEVLMSGALLHDIGVKVDRKKHYEVGKVRAAAILRQTGFPEDKIVAALHVGEAHSRYGGPEPKTTEAKVAQDADALEYVGAIGIVRAVVRGIHDGSFNGDISGFPTFLRAILAKVEGTFHTEKAEQLARSRVGYMKDFLRRIEKELDYEV